MDRNNKFINKIPRKFIYEILLVASGLFFLGLVVSFISPYSSEEKYTFINSGDSTTNTLRATVESYSDNLLKVRLNDSPSKGVSVNVPFNDSIDKRGIQPGASILVVKSRVTNSLSFYDLYRLPTLVCIVAIFVAVVLLVGRRKGLMSLAGLGASIVVIGWIIIPLVIAGYNSLFVTVLGAYIVAIASILIAHGFKKRTFISLLCVLIVLILVTVGSQLAVFILGLTGVVDEASYYLHIDQPKIDLSGILVGGIVIAALGALDDIVTTQVATVDELKKVDKTLNVRDLYHKASSVGGEHIAALVNTLALVYVGAALPLIVSFTVSTQSLFFLLNSEFAATEITRTVIVSIGLVISVPISTFLAAVLLNRPRTKK